MHEATDIDIDYVDNVTFVQDLSIVARTPAAALGSRKGE
jgi:lipopolysaccharide/colanic/teichoic acid biosynthesis glycosyltransferase